MANEDIAHTKPYGDGVHLAMEKLGIDRTEKVVLIGDSDDGVALDNAATVIIRCSQYLYLPAIRAVMPEMLLLPQRLVSYEIHRPFLPNLERLLEDGSDSKGYRYLKGGYFVPWEVEENRERYTISLAGRISRHAAVELRREDSALSAPIEDNKQSTRFPWNGSKLCGTISIVLSRHSVIPS